MSRITLLVALCVLGCSTLSSSTAQELHLIENSTLSGGDVPALSSWYSVLPVTWFRLMPSAADLAMGATHALLDANLNKIHLPLGFEVPLGVANPSSNEAIFSQECNEAIHTALLNQGLQLMPLASADIAIVYALDEMDALQAVIDFRNRSSQEQPPVILPVVVLTPTILRYEWGLWSVSETISSFSAEELLLLSAQPVYHASPFASQTRSYWDPDRFGNITSSVVDVNMEVIEDVAREVVSHFNSGDESMFLGEWSHLRLVLWVG